MENHRFAFADSIFDWRTGTLTRRNRDIYLPEQVARLLAILLERANTVVTREEIKTALWPDEEFLDYDQGINTAINRLRNLIRDNSRTPLIRTIPKRGYSFQGEVKRLVPGPIESIPITPSLAPDSEPIAPLSIVIAIADQLSAPAVQFTSSSTETAATLPRSLWIRWRAVGISAIIILVAVGAWLMGYIRSTNAAPHILRLGIAPLQIHGDTQIADLSEKFRLDITEALSKLPDVEVNAASTLGDGNRGLLGLSSEANKRDVEQLLLGTVIQQGTNYDLKFELVRAADTIHLASFEYSGLRQDLPSIRDRLQQDVFYFLQSRSTTIQTTKGSTNDPRAYDLYLQGTYHVFDRNPNSLRQALTDFQQAIKRDPGFASAYAGMATAYLKLSAFDPSPESGNIPKAEEYAQRALKIDPLLAQAHAVLGYALFAHDWNFRLGEEELRYAIRIDPAQADYRDWLSVVLVDQGRFDEGLQQLTIAQSDDPFWPSVYAMKGMMAAFARRTPESLEAARKYVALLPTSSLAHNHLAWVYFQAGHYEDAVNEWHEMAVLQNDTARANLEEQGMKVLKTRGIRAFALLRLDAIRRNRATAQSNDFIPAEWYACAGKRDEAIAELTRMAAARNHYVLDVAVNPIFDSLHGDRRFENLLKTVGLSVPDSLRGQGSHPCAASG